MSHVTRRCNASSPRRAAWAAAGCALLLVLACQRAESAASEPGAAAATPASAVAARGNEPERAAAGSVGGRSGAALRESVTDRVAPGASASPLAAERTSSLAGSSLASAAACRATRVSGSVQRDGAPLLPGTLLAGAAPIEVGSAATLQLTHGRSARQWSVTGPARLVACADAAEEILLARGTLRAEPAAGVRPGAEVWVGTPYGSLRYADASADISVSERELTVRVRSGQIWFTALADGVERALPGSRSAFSARTQRPSLARASARCARDAEHAQASARELLVQSPRPLGERAAAHVRARQAAHASCASARASALAATTPARPAAQAELAALDRYDQMWRAIPAPATP